MSPPHPTSSALAVQRNAAALLDRLALELMQFLRCWS
jgi:hypothetical protein